MRTPTAGLGHKALTSAASEYEREETGVSQPGTRNEDTK